MKAWAKIAIALIGVMVLSVGAVLAAQVRSGDSITVAADEIVENDFYAAGSTVRIDGVVQGDVYAAGQQVIVSGGIEGTLFAATNSLVVSGEVGGIRGAAGSINLAGAQVSGGVTAFSGSLVMNEESSVGFGLLYFGDNATVEGQIGNGITAFTRSMSIDGEVARNVLVTGESLALGSRADVGSDIVFRSDNEPVVDSDATIAGELSVEPVENAWRGPELRHIGYPLTLYGWLSMLVSGLVLLWLFRRPLSRAAEAITLKPLQSFGLGLGVLLLALPAGVMLLVTVVGIPLALLLWVSIAIGLYLSTIVVSLWGGRKVLAQAQPDRRPKLFASFFVGVSLLHLLYLLLVPLPLLSFIASFLVATVGLGSIALILYRSTIGQRTKRPRRAS